MKIFDFSGGKKGKLLNDSAEKIIPTQGIIGNIEVAISRYRFFRGCKFDAADYGVEAICFCVGKVEDATEDEWDWWFSADLSWVLSYRQRWDSEESDLIHGTKTTEGKPLSERDITSSSELYKIIDTPLEMELTLDQVVVLLNHTILLKDGTIVKQGAITESLVKLVNGLHQVKAV